MIDYLSIPEHVPVSQAASILGLSCERVLQHVRSGHLAAQKVQGRYMIPLVALSSFPRKPHGRLRTKAVQWRRYRTSDVLMCRIAVPVHLDRLTALSDRLVTMAKEQRHCFLGTMQRLISVEKGYFTVLLIWKSTELDERQLEHDLAAFKDDFRDVVDWQCVQQVEACALAYT